MNAMDVRRDLQLDVAELDAVVAGNRVMSLPHQLSFATLLIERVPRLARGGKTLREQVLAAIAYTTGATTVHNSHPMKWSGLKTRRS